MYREGRRIHEHLEDTVLKADERQILTAFVVDNADLERLEALIGQFNIFEAVGVAHHELRHSDFLGFLLDPRQPHGLGDAFAKRFLQQALLASESRRDISPIDLDAWSLRELMVQREWRNIDILLIDESHRVVAAIENKIFSGEHSDQLGRYRRLVEEHFPGWRQVFIFLTPEGEEPTDDTYVVVDYGSVCDIVERLAETRKSALDPALHTMMMHYGRMLRRHVVPDSEIAELCRRIYQSHQQALDLIFEHRPDEQAVMAQFLADLITSEERVVLRHAGKQEITFTYRDWDRRLESLSGDWTSAGGLLYFGFVNLSDRIVLRQIVGPGPQELRGQLISAAQQLGPPFKAGSRQTEKWKSILSLDVLSRRAYAAAEIEERRDAVRQWWGDFLRRVLPDIVEKLNPAVVQTASSQVARQPLPSMHGELDAGVN